MSDFIRKNCAVFLNSKLHKQMNYPILNISILRRCELRKSREMSELKQSWQALRESQSGLRIRDAAVQLGVSEAALLETRIGEGVARLAVRIDALRAALPYLGTVMSLVRNESA